MLLLSAKHYICTIHGFTGSTRSRDDLICKQTSAQDKYAFFALFVSLHKRVVTSFHSVKRFNTIKACNRTTNNIQTY